MAGEGVIHVQRTFWRLPARTPAAGSRRPAVRLCKPKAKRSKPEAKVQKRVRIHQMVRPQIVRWVREARRVQAMGKHTTDVYANPMQAGGRSKHGNDYVEAALKGDPRILLDFVVYAICEYTRLEAEMRKSMEPPATTALPGTAEKVEEMRKRQEMFQALHSDWDAKRS
jgi:hypothetical protein